MKAFVGFSGFGGVDIAMHSYGIETLGVEYDEKIADVAIMNGHNVIKSDILDLSPGDYSGFDLAHFSPPCPNFSVAKQDAEESELDIKLGEWVAAYIRVNQPRLFTLEDVWGYRHSQSWQLIRQALERSGYHFGFWHLNAADYGVPQIRKRMLVLARNDGKPVYKPFPTHRKQPDFFAQPWVGWYEAMEDLIPTLPETKPAPWQIARLPDGVKESFLIMTGNSSFDDSRRGQGVLYTDSPSNTVMCSHDENRIFLIQGQNSSRLKLFCQNDQVPTVTSLNKGDFKINNDNVWLKATPQCLARFQSFPDDYKLPDNKTLALKGIGNAVPVDLYKAVLESLLK